MERRDDFAVLPFCAWGLALVGCFAFLDSPSFYVALPVLTLALFALGLFEWVRRTKGDLPLDDLGVYYGIAIFMYGGLPLSAFIANGLRYTPESDFRLFRDQPGPGVIAELGWMHVAYFAAFFAAYVVVRRRPTPSSASTQNRSSLRLVVFSLATAAVLFAVQYAIESAFNIERVAYGEQPQFDELPLLAKQVYANSFLVLLPVKLIALTALFEDYKRYRYLTWVFLGLLLLPVLLRFGERHEMVVLCLAALLLYHRRVQAIPLGRFALLGMALLGIFLVMGNLRVGGERVRMLGTNEFEACFSTARDILQASRDGRLANAPVQIYLADFLAPIPQQLLPFEKMDQNEWYLGQFFPDLIRMKQGYAFGVIAESAIGLGWAELVVKGAIVGAIFAWISNWYQRRGAEWWVATIYIFICATCFRTFRSSTFELIRSILYGVVPALLSSWAVLWLASAPSEHVRIPKLSRGTLR